MKRKFQSSLQRRHKDTAGVLLVFLLSLPAIAPDLKAQTAGGVASSFQSKARPLGLSIVDPVMLAGSDEASSRFLKETLPSVTAFLSTKLSERARVNDSAMLLDPSRLRLQTESDVRVYFIGEGAGYSNTLGFNTSGGGVDSGKPQLIFPNASSSVSAYEEASTARRPEPAALMPGDFVNLGQMPGGTLLNFFIIANGANGGRTEFSTDASVNPDGINHVVAFAYAVPGSSFLIVGFEDLLGGGDRDFNDLLFAVDIGARNIAALTGTPEPMFCATLASLTLGTVWLKRRRDRALRQSSPTPA